MISLLKEGEGKGEGRRRRGEKEMMLSRQPKHQRCDFALF